MNNQEILIRTASVEDLDELCQLFDAYRIFYRQDSDPDAAMQFLRERLDRKDSRLFVSIDATEDKLTGFTQLYPIFSSVRMKPVWLLNDLYVLQEYRGKGISKALIERCKKLVLDSGSFGMILETEVSNSIGNSLYPRVGMKLIDDSYFYSWEAGDSH